MMNRGVSGYLTLGGQVVMWRAAAAMLPLGGAFYSAKNWVGNTDAHLPLMPLFCKGTLCCKIIRSFSFL